MGLNCVSMAVRRIAITLASFQTNNYSALNQLERIFSPKNVISAALSASQKKSPVDRCRPMQQSQDLQTVI